MINLILRGIRRAFFGSTSVFAVRSGSCPMLGNSFAIIHQERTQDPLRVVGVQFAADPSTQGEWRISVGGIGKVFPYSETNPLDSDYHNLMPIEIAAGSLFCIEVRSRNKEYRGIAILEELDVVEMR